MSCLQYSQTQSIVIHLLILIQPLSFVFIEVLDKLITYIVCRYKTLYQVLSVVWTNHIITRRYCDPIQNLVPAHYVYNWYVSMFSSLYIKHKTFRNNISHSIFFCVFKSMSTNFNICYNFQKKKKWFHWIPVT